MKKELTPERQKRLNLLIKHRRLIHQMVNNLNNASRQKEAELRLVFNKITKFEYRVVGNEHNYRIMYDFQINQWFVDRYDKGSWIDLKEHMSMHDNCGEAIEAVYSNEAK